MPYRKIPDEIKVKALEEYVSTNDLNEIAEKYGINRATLNIYYQRLIAGIPEVVKNKKPVYPGVIKEYFSRKSSFKNISIGRKWQLLKLPE